jgi:thiol-disulfide isomerase/thioredoxin
VRFLVLCLLLAPASFAQLVPYVQALVTRGDMPDARALTARYRQQYGATPEAWAAMSWLARGEMNLHQYDQAITAAENLRDQIKGALGGRKLDSDPYTPLALGATYEVQAQALVALKRRSEALQLLQSAEKEWRGTSVESRLRKNVLLLTLVGHPLPEIRGVRNTWQGKPALFFFWAQWCADCKADAPVMAKIASEFEPKGLVVVAPTQYYGYTATQENVPPAVEKQVIQQVFQQYYAVIPKAIVTVDASNFDRFGASTTPTIVLSDRHGIVRLYHPGYMDEASLREAVENVMTPASAKR